MFTTLDKALIALVMAILSILSLVFKINIGVDPTVIGTVITALTPVLVYFIPNKTAASTNGS